MEIVAASIGAAATLVAVVVQQLWPKNLSPGPPPTPTVAAVPLEIMDPSGTEMRLIPEGVFIMGSDIGEGDVRPRRRIYLDAYYMDVHEVTNAQYRKCVREASCGAPLRDDSHTRRVYYRDSQYDQYPVLWVNWDMAKAFCDWRAARLPSEAEWEKAARGPDSRSYPWGEELDCTDANYSGCVGDTLATGLYERGKSLYGVYDMTGNVAEWVADWYSEAFYGTSNPKGEFNPTGPTTGSYRVVRGGSWYASINGLTTFARTALSPSSADDQTGFRCARAAHP